MVIPNVGINDIPFVQLLMRVHAKQDFNSPQSHETADDVIIISFYQVSIKLGKTNVRELQNKVKEQEGINKDKGQFTKYKINI